ncbi:MAG: Gfo/Idh/MocA family oxidoreductase [Ignavibacteriales bacterium]|nr:Gfo/Idh/MocA family oxidoreductase [Ignavibacteriales bacterium]
MNKIRYGIIGFGAFAERAIMPAIRKCENSELVAIQKRSLDMAKWKAEEHGIPLYFDSVDRLVASPDVDAVFIVSANGQHHPETLFAAKAKKHILVEKPMALNAAQGKEMIEACKSTNVKFMVGHMLRFSPLIRRMKEIVQSGMIGEISFARSEFIYDAGMSQRGWLWDKHAAGGGPLFDIGIHCLDSIRCVLDDTVASVQSMMRHADGANKVEKTNVMTLRFSKGTLAAVYSSFESSYRQTYIEFVGTKGSLSAFYFTPSNTPTTLEIKFGSQGNLSDVKKEEIFVPDLYQLEVTHFSDCILNDTQPLVSADSALHNQEVLDLALKNSV